MALVWPSLTYAQSTLITFDDINVPTSSDSISAPNSYDGLQWNNFGIEDTTTLISIWGFTTGLAGYVYGMVSAPNVGFNMSGTPASITASSLFDLDSAYLAAAWNNGLQVEVQGLVGATLIYDNTYTVNATGSTLVNFNYLGVNKVNFISSGGVSAGYIGAGTQFVMDNLTVTEVPEPDSIGLLMFGTFVIGLAGFRNRNQLCD